MKSNKSKNQMVQEESSMTSEQEDNSQQESRQFEQIQSNNQPQQQDQQIIQKKKQQLLQMEQRNIKSQLKNIPFGQLIKYRKLKQQINKSTKKQIIKDRSKREQPTKVQKYDKNASKQIKIMKRPPKTKLKQIFQSERPKSIDPRFESYAGHYNADLASKSYQFIKDMQKNQVNYLKKQISNKKLNEEDREIMLKNYNKVTNDIKRYQNQQIQRKVKSDFKNKNFNLKKRQFKQQVQRAKLDAMDHKSQDKRLKKKEKKIQKQRTIQRKQFMNNYTRK